MIPCSLANTVQELALANTLHVVDRDGRVFPRLSYASTGKLAESWSEVVNRMGKDRYKLTWSDVVETMHVKNVVLARMHQPGLAAESTGSPPFGEMDRAAQYANYDLNKFKEEDWSPSADFVRQTECSASNQSVDYGDLVTSCGAIGMFIGSGKKVSAGSSVLSEMPQCKNISGARASWAA